MKKNYLLIILSPLFLFSCKSSFTAGNNLSDELKEQAGQKIRETLVNPNSYEPISWSKVDTLMQPNEEDEKQMHRIMFVTDSLNNSIFADTVRSSSEKQYEDRIKHHQLVIAQLDELESQRSALSRSMKKKPIGWFVKHQCKTTGKLSTIDVRNYLIYLNMDLNKVDSVRDFTETERFLKKL